MVYVVELTGARGVGKTTLAAFLRAEFGNRRVPVNVVERATLADRVMSNIAIAPERLRMERLWRAWGLDAYEDVRSFKRRFRHYQVRRRRYAPQSGIFLLEEGVFQLMLMIHIRTGREIEGIARSLSELVPMPDMVISVEASEESIGARRRQRGNARDLLRLQMSARSSEGLKRFQEYLRNLSSTEMPRALFVQSAAYSELESVAVGVVDQILGISQSRTVSAGNHGRPQPTL